MSIQGQINRIAQNVSDTYSTLNDLGASMPAQQTSDSLAATARSVTAVLYGKEQNLTDEQKAQARKNIGLEGSGSVNEIISMTAAEFDALTAEEKAVMYANGVRIIAVEGGVDLTELTEQQKFANFVYPVGAIVELTVSTDPASLWGFGTWQSYLPGRVLVGAGTSDSGTVYAAGSVGGSETMELVAAIGACNDNAGTLGYIVKDQSAYQSANVPTYVVTGGNTGFNHWNHSTPVSEMNESSDRVSRMQPYGVVYRWLRIA